jgi:hypothetical protein
VDASSLLDASIHEGVFCPQFLRGKGGEVGTDDLKRDSRLDPFDAEAGD